MNSYDTRPVGSDREQEVCTDGWIPTWSGKTFDFSDPQPEQIDIRDIAIGLARAARFAGQTIETYTVAQHSILGSTAFESPELALEFLLHDAPEAYTGDLVRPFKRLLGPELVRIENGIHLAIAAKFGIPAVMSPAVKVIDERMLATERRDICRPHAKPWSLDERSVEPLPIRIGSAGFRTTLITFLNRFEELTKQPVDRISLPMF